MSLVYNSSCPPDYQPQGFHDATPSSSQENVTNWSMLWQQPSAKLEDFDSGHHHVTIGASNAKAFLTANDFTLSQEEDVNFTNQLQAMQKSSPQPSHVVSTLSQRNQLEAMQNQSSQPVHQLSQRKPLSKPYKVTDNQEQTKHFNKSISDQVTSSTATRPGLKSFSQISNRSGPSVVLGRSKKAIPAVRASLKYRRRRNIVPEKIAELVVYACAVENNNKGDYIFDPDELKKNRIVRLLPAVEVKCECQSMHQIEEMVTLLELHFDIALMILLSYPVTFVAQCNIKPAMDSEAHDRSDCPRSTSAMAASFFRKKRR
jgi:HORMA domain